MTAVVIPYVFSGAVVKGGTFTVGYPAGYTKGSFSEGKIRRLFVNQHTFVAPTDFTVSFGATVATITYNSSTPIASGARASIEFDVPGEVSRPNPFQHLAVGAVNNISPILIDLGSPLAAVTTAFINAATGAGQLPNANTIAYTTATLGTAPLNGSNTTWVQDMPRNMVATITHASSIVAMTIQIKGVDIFNQPMGELLTVTATGTSETVNGLKAFYKVTEIDLIATSDSTTNTVSIGFGNALGLPVYVTDIREVFGEVQDGVLVGGAQAAPIRMPWLSDTVDSLVGTSGPELIAPCDGTIGRLGVAVRTAVTTGGTVTTKVVTTAVTGQSVTVANSATKGTQAFSYPTVGSSTATVLRDQRIQVVTASFATAAELEGFLEIIPTGLKTGTLAKGLSSNTAPTATTADVRGTYTPNANITLDGTIGFMLYLLSPNPSYVGSTQFHY